MKISYESPSGHPVDPDLPAHWTDIVAGQSVKDRSAAIMQNVNRDLDQALHSADEARSIQYAAGRPRLLGAKGHPVDRNLPGYWDGIDTSQTSEERTEAILRNIGYDRALRARGVDPVEYRRVQSSGRMTARQALARVAALTRNLPS